MHWVFVWTIQDIIGLFFLSLALLLGAFVAAVLGLDKLTRWRRTKG